MTPIENKNACLLINTFMDLPVYEDHRYGQMYRHPVTRDAKMEMKYHDSWDWIMPVIEKIEQLDNNSYGVEYNPWEIKIVDYSTGCEPEICCISTDEDLKKIDMWFMAVIEFINWYNQKYILELKNKEDAN